MKIITNGVLYLFINKLAFCGGWEVHSHATMFLGLIEWLSSCYEKVQRLEMDKNEKSLVS